jgi:hypothetical protein
MDQTMFGFTFILFWVVAGICVLLAVRWTWLWYFKIDKILSVLTEIRDRLPAEKVTRPERHVTSAPVPPVRVTADTWLPRMQG